MRLISGHILTHCCDKSESTSCRWPSLYSTVKAVVSLSFVPQTFQVGIGHLCTVSPRSLSGHVGSLSPKLATRVLYSLLSLSWVRVGLTVHQKRSKILFSHLQTLSHVIIMSEGCSSQELVFFACLPEPAWRSGTSFWKVISVVFRPWWTFLF